VRYNFNDSFGFILVKTGRLIENRLKLNFDKEGIDITPQQWSALTYLWNEDGISQQKLADAFSKDKTSMTRLLNNMEKNDLIERRKDGVDKRNKKIFLTYKSRLLKKSTIKIAEKTLMETLVGINHDDLKLSKKVLKKINNNLEK
jgi:DNA-binding MarR family transcriptional regulator